MCGIFGILHHKSTALPSQCLLAETARILRHRGPDGYGIYSDIGVGLVHTRLSLIDPNPRSNQPFWSKDGRYGLVYNGEIYNYMELREQLEKRNIRFRTTSDTEVLLEGLIHNDPLTFLPTLEGMFAFALYDKSEKSLVVARDRFGIKPLYLYDSDEMFLFSSEVKAMASYVKLEPDFFSISSYLQGFDGPTKNHTFFRNIKILPPGTVVKICAGQPAQYTSFFTVSDFWDDTQAEELRRLNPRTIIDQTEDLLLRSVQKHLIADVPVGALCSGGVDSSTVMAMATKFHNNLAIFHANVTGPESEYDAAFALAKHLKLDLKSVDVHQECSIENMPDVIEHYEHPFLYHPNSTPFLLVSQLVRDNGVKAVLSGEGADEDYLGYHYLANEHPLRGYRKIPVYVRAFLQRIPKIRAVIPNHNDDIKNFIPDLHNRFEILSDNETITQKVQRSARKNICHRDLRSLDLLHYHLRTLLHRNDCLGMAASVESRFPFLDHTLVRQAVNMPYHLKIHLSWSLNKPFLFLEQKWVLRQVAARYLPPQLSFRDKRGFPANTFQRMRISPEYFVSSSVADLFELSHNEVRFLTDRADRQVMLKLLHLDVWSDMFLKRRSKEAIRDRLRRFITIC